MITGKFGARWLLWMSGGIICSLTVIWVCMWWVGVDHRAVWVKLISLRISSILLIILASLVTCALRALRLRLLFPSLTPVDALRVTTTHTALTRILPARSGELSLPATLSRLGFSLGDGALAMVWLRLLEVACLFSTLLLASFVLAEPLLFHWTWIGLGLLVSTIAIFITRPLLAKMIYSVQKHLPDKWSHAPSLTSSLERAKVTRITLCTLLILLSQAMLFWSILNAVGAELGYLKALIGSGGVHLAGIIPAPTIGNVGSHELGWALSYSQLGVSAAAVTSSAILSQWLTLILALLWWLLASLIPSRHPSEAGASSS